MINPNNRPAFGSDPEGFFKRRGKIIGSEKLIPENGISGIGGSVHRDGVQFELHPRIAYYNAQIGYNISGCFAALQERLKKAKGVSICFDGLVEVERKELDSLSPACRVLGCMPSYNIYGDKAINVDPVEYRKRSSGGHIHFGFYDNPLREDRRRMVPALDVMVGMFSVLLDRDPGAAERRENYGRAGEFRLPEHGLEYRTTSNFWLRDFTLMDFTFGMAHVAFAMTFQAVNGDKSLWADLVKKVAIQKVRQAIDTNDFDLALKQVKHLVPFLKKNLPEQGFPLTPKNLDKFIGFAVDANARGIETYFPTDKIVSNWLEQKQETFAEFLERL